MRVALAAALLLAAPAATLLMAASAAAQPAQGSWQARIQGDDRPRLAGLWRAWTQAIAEIAATPQGEAQIAALGALAVPPVPPSPGVVQLPSSHPLPGAGAYRCRTIRMGLRDDGWPRDGVSPVQIGEWGACAIGGDLSFLTQAGPQRYTGQLWPDADRMIFMGALHLASESGTRRYGDDAERDQLGVLRPLAPGHWRLELPWPRWQAKLVLVEIKAD